MGPPQVDWYYCDRDAEMLVVLPIESNHFIVDIDTTGFRYAHINVPIKDMERLWTELGRYFES